MITMMLSKLSVVCLIGLLVFQGCASRELTPSQDTRLVKGDGFIVRLDSFSISYGSPSIGKLQLTVWNKSEKEIAVEAKNITVVDSEGQSAVSAEKLYVVDQERREASAGETVGATLICVVGFIICAPLMIAGAIAQPIREAGRHRPAVAVKAGGDETVSISLTERPVRFDKLSFVRVKFTDPERLVELPIANVRQ